MADLHDNNDASPDDATGADRNEGISQRGKIEFRCTCGMLFRVDAEMAGQKGRCKTCGVSLLIPGGRVDVADVAQEGISSEATTPPDVDVEKSAPLLDASAAETGWPIDKDGPFPEIDDYKIIEAMQAGGQGKLFKARELTPSGREVVLKFPRGGVFSSDRAVALFENEVQKAASLDHPNIARIYSSGLYDRMPFYSMEFIDGVDLDEYVKETDLGHREILELMRTVCLAAQHAHQRQLVHRDLKPANIMVTRDGAVPKLLDFGLAIEETDLQATVDRGVGTLLYMSPEQAAYESVTTQTDVYSLGVILYELLTGEHPHWSEDQDGQTLSPGQFRDRIANGEPIRPRRVSKHVDQELEALILKALAHDPEDRYRSAGDLAADIKNYLTGEPLTAKAPTTIYFLRKRLRKYRTRVAIAAAALAVLLGVAVFAYVSVTLERDRALAAEQDASEQRDLARKETVRANAEREIAVAAKQSESEQRSLAKIETARAETADARAKMSSALADVAQAAVKTADEAVKKDFATAAGQIRSLETITKHYALLVKDLIAEKKELQAKLDGRAIRAPRGVTGSE